MWYFHCYAKIKCQISYTAALFKIKTQNKRFDTRSKKREKNVSISINSFIPSKDRVACIVHLHPDCI